MLRAKRLQRVTVLLLIAITPVRLATASLTSITFQDIGGSLAFQGQDIIGGAAVIFKPPQRVRDLVGAASSIMAVRRPARSSRSSDVARNRPRPTATPTTTTAAATTTAATDRVETLITE